MTMSASVDTAMLTNHTAAIHPMPSTEVALRSFELGSIPASIMLFGSLFTIFAFRSAAPAQSNCARDAASRSGHHDLRYRYEGPAEVKTPRDTSTGGCKVLAQTWHKVDIKPTHEARRIDG